MYQLVEQLNWALNNIDSISVTPVKTAEKLTSTTQKDDPVSNFNSIKGLIIKSADIVKAYYEEIDNLLKISGEYVAQGDFSTFREETNLKVGANSKEVTLLLSDVKEILSDIEAINNDKLETKAHIQVGTLYENDGVPVSGVEVGQTVVRNGEKVFEKFARFTADMLAFYDPTAAADDEPIAYISGYNLYITNTHITGSLKIGGYRDFVDSNGGIVTRWEGV
jgi:hypothetical protein